MICTTCCGTEREQSIDCPLHCEYLRDAHMHERRPDPDFTALPNSDIELTEDFPAVNEFLIVLLVAPLAKLIAVKPAITDFDMREAFEALIKSWRTLEAGLVYDQTPTNPYAADICETIREQIETIRGRAAAEDPDAQLSDTQVLRVLVFLQRLEYSWNNARRKSRAFIDLITRPYEEELPEPEEPRIIL